MNEGHKSLKVYQQAYEAAMRIFTLSKSFPTEEKYALTDQIRRSSRAVCANISEGYRKRLYPKHFANKMTDADGECSETLVWLDFAKDCGYLTEAMHTELSQTYHGIGRMLNGMIHNPEKFIPKQ